MQTEMSGNPFTRKRTCISYIHLSIHFAINILQTTKNRNKWFYLVIQFRYRSIDILWTGIYTGTFSSSPVRYGDIQVSTHVHLACPLGTSDLMIMVLTISVVQLLRQFGHDLVCMGDIHMSSFFGPLKTRRFLH